MRKMFFKFCVLLRKSELQNTSIIILLKKCLKFCSKKSGICPQKCADCPLAKAVWRLDWERGLWKERRSLSYYSGL